MHKFVKNPTQVLLLLLFSAATAMAQQTMPLYAGEVPNQTTQSAAKQPTLTAYLPEQESATGVAVIICPGGGYGSLVLKREGTDVAQALNKMGIAAFVLEYRLPNSATMQDKSIGPLQDAQQAIKTVRQQAAKWNIDPNKIGIMGFSAGGHLASTAGTHFQRNLIDNKEKTSLRPDFMVLVYPVISFSDEMAHKGSRENLLGTSPTEEQIRLFSNELQVTAQTPPAFLIHAGDDSKVPVQNSLRFYEALLHHQVPAELHIYPKGEHGFALGAPKDNWLERCRHWLAASGWIK
ncbi:alpha/beta hydrolase [Pontibacter beigongshangensis]|uniref:alpha/beta hydrolase n=1 Tax=Pontibacter beigongshangensis TaxID=2574733 RepID=UPI00164FB660|nr:alpha/beta hydrolase [Pontibacter beigongshangensis]